MPSLASASFAHAACPAVYRPEPSAYASSDSTVRATHASAASPVPKLASTNAPREGFEPGGRETASSTLCHLAARAASAHNCSSNRASIAATSRGARGEKRPLLLGWKKRAPSRDESKACAANSSANDETFAFSSSTSSNANALDANDCAEVGCVWCVCLARVHAPRRVTESFFSSCATRASAYAVAAASATPNLFLNDRPPPFEDRSTRTFSPVLESTRISGTTTANTFSTCFSSTRSRAPDASKTSRSRRRGGDATIANFWTPFLVYATASPSRTSSRPK
mmetsp:Transcript_11700/g.49048  ORF Transcript_11700/g.49048 Transcript_11700/m.49048 type:complete len:282 (+) Transcript_11700:1893-2738(+)